VPPGRRLRRPAESRRNPPRLAVRLLKALPFPACLRVTKTRAVERDVGGRRFFRSWASPERCRVREGRVPVVDP
jgi:hypothetical protein